MLSQVRSLFERAVCTARNNRGQGLVEYALILVLIAIVVLLAVKNVGVTTSTAFSKVDSSLK